MKLTKETLKQIIKEELDKVINEQESDEIRAYNDKIVKKLKDTAEALSSGIEADLALRQAEFVEATPEADRRPGTKGNRGPTYVYYQGKDFDPDPRKLGREWVYRYV